MLENRVDAVRSEPCVACGELVSPEHREACPGCDRRPFCGDCWMSHRCEDPDSVNVPNLEAIAAPFLETVISLCQADSLSKCFSCGQKFDTSHLKPCAACRDFAQNYCASCSFIDGHKCVLNERPSASVISSQWGEPIWSVQCSICKGYNHPKEECPVIQAKRDQEFCLKQMKICLNQNQSRFLTS